jgi:hypothetical protein
MTIVEVHLCQLKFRYSRLTRIFVDLVTEGRVEYHTFSVLRIAEDRMANPCARLTHLSQSLPYSRLKGNSSSKQDRKRERFDSGRRTVSQKHRPLRIRIRHRTLCLCLVETWAKASRSVESRSNSRHETLHCEAAEISQWTLGLYNWHKLQDQGS